MNNYINIFLAAAVIIILIIFFLTFLSKNDEKIIIEDQKPVKIQKVIRKDLAAQIHSSGILSLKDEALLSFKTDGIIDDIYFNEGDFVKKGELIARLKLNEIENRVIQAKSAYEKAKRDYERVEKLYKDQVATLENLQDVKTACDIALSNYNIAEFNQQYSEIHAPSDGKILRKISNRNEVTGAGRPVVLFGSTKSQWILKTGLSDREVVQVKTGDPAEIFFDAYPGLKFQGIIEEIAEAADPSSGTFKAEVKLKVQNVKLITGMVGTVDIFSNYKNQFYIIPIEALVEADGNSGYVYSFDGKTGRVKKVKVNIARIFDNELGILSGLENVDQVVTDGAAYLKDGSVVKMAN